jgi:DNA-binding response OmpR family regulator
VVEARDGPSALAAHAKEAPDLVILDVNLPHVDGFAVLRRLRSDGARTPVMMLTVRAGEEDQVRGLDLGADDYLAKPFSPRTLLARVRALLRRAGLERPGSMEAGDLALDTEAQAVRIRRGPPVRLTGLEFRLLQFMLASAGHTLSAERLTRHVWGHRGAGDRQLLKQLVRRLRQKIERDPADPDYLVTAPGQGYLLKTASRGG